MGFQTNPQVMVTLKGSDTRRRKNVRQVNADPIEMQVYDGDDIVSGTVEIAAPSNKRVEYKGMKLELIGQTELIHKDDAVPFLQGVKILESAPGTLSSRKSFNFEFNQRKVQDSYSGLNVKLRYFIRVTVSRNYMDYVKEHDIYVENSMYDCQMLSGGVESPQAPIKMEVGIEECLHIEFEFDRSKYHLKDVILGKIDFLLVRIKIKYMELAVIRRESAGRVGSSGPSYNDPETITKYELMDGAPIKGECVPIRLFLGPLELTPTYKSINNMFSVKYFLNLVLIDEEDRRYFKQQEVVFWRQLDNVDGASVDRASTKLYATGGPTAEENNVRRL